MSELSTKQEILDFWFKECRPEQWYKKDKAFDATLIDRFGTTIEAALEGNLDNWINDREGCLALILLLDQFTRNIYRDTPRAFAGDEKALLLSQKAVVQGFIDEAPSAWRQFMLMPMMHSEDIKVQDASLPLFKECGAEIIYEYAVKHRNIVAKFGRFPHRNAILGRQSSAEEIAFLEQPGSSF
jgi:uncharacterized protein (DUF924 family)